MDPELPSPRWAAADPAVRGSLDQGGALAAPLCLAFSNGLV